MLFSPQIPLQLEPRRPDRFEDFVPGPNKNVLLATRQMLEEPGSICVLMDAPPMEGRPAISKRVLGSDASFNEGFPTMLASCRKQYVFYAMNLSEDGSLRKKLELEGPSTVENPEEFLERYAEFLDRHLALDSPHWRIWRAGHQFWR